MKNLLIGLTLLLSSSAFAKTVKCSAECGFYDLEKHGLTRSLPGNPVIMTHDFQSLNDTCRALVAGYANSPVLMKNVTLAEIPSLNTRIKSSWGTSEALDEFEKGGVKVVAVLHGKIGTFSSPSGTGDLIGFPIEADACK